MNELVDAAVEAASALPSPPAFRAWCLAHRAGRAEDETVKRALRAVMARVARGRFDDFTRLLAHAESRIAVLKRDEIAGWAQAAAARAVLELRWSEQRQSSVHAAAGRTRAAAIAAAALRFASAATRAQDAASEETPAP